METTPSRPLKVFLCHTSSDKPAVRALYEWLRDEKIDVWLDEENLLPGQDWQAEIPKAVQSSDAIILCVSNRSLTKEGYVQKEIRFALDSADEKPEGTIFIIPCRLEECNVPTRLSRWQYVDLFFDNGFFTQGHERLLKALHERATQLGIESPKSFSDKSKSNRSAVSKRRLESDYIKVLDLMKRTHGKITLEQMRGTPPEIYVFKFRCRVVLSLRNNEPLWGDEVTVKVTLPEKYPRESALYEVLSPIYHPQVSRSALCAGWNNSYVGLDLLVIGLYQIVAFLNYSLSSPMDSRAAQWYFQHPQIIKELQTMNSLRVEWLETENILSQI